MSDTPKPVYIFSHPRTRSNLLARLLETHPRIGVPNMYPFRAAFCAGPERPLADFSVFATKDIDERETFQFAYDSLNSNLDQDLSKGLIPLVKDHVLLTMSPAITNSYCQRSLREGHVIKDPDGTSSTDGSTFQPNGNPTCLPDSFLSRIIPIITIRDPIRMVASSMGVMLRDLGAKLDEPHLEASCTFRWSKFLFDYYQSRGGPAFIVIDGDRLVTDPEGQMKKLCALINIEESGIQYTWEPRRKPPNKEMLEHVFIGVMHRSTGIIRGKVPKLDLEEEVKKWEEEWGAEVAETMRGYVERTMDDYQYLLRHAI
ncbi:hypothetical protein VNI00_007010 [Paramarasmius palmivorus]|uniref:Sulfotransferase n=1 Tax=Paramarasmius palmivorus TaxID=297713 RepID=A0AAW0D0N0_9AGAR